MLEFGAAAEACGLETLVVAESITEAMVCFSELTSAFATFKPEMLEPGDR